MSKVVVTVVVFCLSVVIGFSTSSQAAEKEEPLMAAVSRKAAADAKAAATKSPTAAADTSAKPPAQIPVKAAESTPPKVVARPKPKVIRKPEPSADGDPALAVPKAVKKREPEPPPDIEVIKEQEQIIRYANSHLQDLRWRQRECVDCYVSSAGADNSILEMSDSKRACVDKWNDFYNKEPLDPAKPDGPKKPVDIRIVLGYLDRDVDSFVGDRVIRQSMVKTLTAPCEANNLVQVCGFKQSVQEGDFFEKEVMGPKGEMQTVRVTLTASSASPSDRLNKVEQERQSAAAEKVFNDGIAESDMLLYVGHARGGGGPDFRPAKRNARGAIDLDSYRAEQPGLKALDAAFNNAKVNGQKKTPKILGFLACDAEVWRARLERWAPKSGLLLSGTDQVEFQTAVGMAYLALDSVLWQRCSEEFDRAANTLIDYRKKPQVPISLRRFFKRTN